MDPREQPQLRLLVKKKTKRIQELRRSIKNFRSSIRTEKLRNAGLKRTNNELVLMVGQLREQLQKSQKMYSLVNARLIEESAAKRLVEDTLEKLRSKMADIIIESCTTDTSRESIISINYRRNPGFLNRRNSSAMTVAVGDVSSSDVSVPSSENPPPVILPTIQENEEDEAVSEDNDSARVPRSSSPRESGVELEEGSADFELAASENPASLPRPCLVVEESVVSEASEPAERGGRGPRGSAEEGFAGFPEDPQVAESIRRENAENIQPRIKMERISRKVSSDNPTNNQPSFAGSMQIRESLLPYMDALRDGIPLSSLLLADIKPDISDVSTIPAPELPEVPLSLSFLNRENVRLKAEVCELSSPGRAPSPAPRPSPRPRGRKALSPLDSCSSLKTSSFHPSLCQSTPITTSSQPKSSVRDSSDLFAGMSPFIAPSPRRSKCVPDSPSVEVQQSTQTGNDASSEPPSTSGDGVTRRTRKAVISYKEPKLNKKLRREK